VIEMEILRCAVCEEIIPTYDHGMYREVDVGEFWDDDAQDSIIAHAECGISAGLDLA